MSPFNGDELKEMDPFFETRNVFTHNATYRSNCVPSVARLPNDNLLTVCLTRTGKDGRKIRGSFSSDNGATWDPPVILAENPKIGWIGDPTVFVTPDEKVILTYVKVRSYKDGKVVWRVSTDNGKTWGDEAILDTGHAYSVMNRNGITLRDGTLIWAFAWETHADRGVEAKVSGIPMDEKSTVLRSTDNGETWMRGGDVYAPPFGASEPTVVELTNGDLYMLCRTAAGRLWQATSSDQGRTWGEATPSSLVSPSAPAMLLRISFEPNRVIVIWDNSPPAGRWIAPGKVEGSISSPRYPLDIAISYDDCKTWKYSKTLANPGRQVAYPSATTTKDGYVLAVWHDALVQDWSLMDIVGAKFNEEWITSK